MMKEYCMITDPMPRRWKWQSLLPNLFYDLRSVMSSCLVLFLSLSVGCTRADCASPILADVFNAEGQTQKWGQGCLISLSSPLPSPRLASQDCHLIPLYYLLSCSSTYPYCSFCLFSFFHLPTAPFSWLFFQKIVQHFSLRDGLFGMALVWQLGDDSWLVLCAACCHIVLIFAIMLCVHSSCTKKKRKKSFWYR